MLTSILNTCITVSYTHLDVYKRQDQRRSITNLAAIGLVPVYGGLTIQTVASETMTEVTIKTFASGKGHEIENVIKGVISDPSGVQFVVTV